MDWLDWTFSPPPRDVLIMVKTPLGIDIGRPSEFGPEFNITNAQWKLTGIGREEVGWEWKPEPRQWDYCSYQNMNWFNLFTGGLGGLGASQLGGSLSLL